MEKLDITSPLPLYHQLKEQLKGKIESQEWKPGEQIPTEMDIADMFQISRSTVRNAILDLVREGVLIRQRGKGTFVAQPKQEVSYIMDFFPRKMDGKHMNISVKEGRASIPIAGKLKIQPGDPVLVFVRLRYIKDIPSVLEKSYISLRSCPEVKDINLDFQGKLYEWINSNCQNRISRAISTIEPVILDSYECDLFNIKNTTAGFLILRTNLNKEDEPLVYSKSIIRGDKYRIEVKTSEQGVITVENR